MRSRLRPPDDEAGGRYTLRADRLEPVDGLPAAVDAFNAAATVTRGGAARGGGRAAGALDAALDVWRRLGQRDLEAQTLVRLGLVQTQRAGRPLDAARSFTEAAALFEALRFEADLANAEVLLALAQRQAGQIARGAWSAANAPTRGPRGSLLGCADGWRASCRAPPPSSGDAELGLRYARQAVATFRELGDNESLMTALQASPSR